jgi:hypothetical protein
MAGILLWEFDGSALSVTSTMGQFTSTPPAASAGLRLDHTSVGIRHVSIQ